MFKKFQSFLQKHVDRSSEIEHLQMVNEKLLCRSNRFKTACISMERQKGNLQLQIQKLKETHDHAHRRNMENRVAELEAKGSEDLALIARQVTVIARQRTEILHLIEGDE